jgi:Ca2+-binding RTX toxin-like protein
VANADTLTGGLENDPLYGRRGNDTIYGRGFFRGQVSAGREVARRRKDSS